MALNTLVISSYPPDRCGIAKYTVQYAAAQRRAGEHLEIVSTKFSAAQHQADMWTWRGILTVLALTYRYDRSVVQFFPDLMFRSMYKRQFLPHWPWVALLFGFGKKLEVVVHEAPYPELIGWPGWRGRVMRMLWRLLFSLPRRTFVHTDWEREQLVAATGISPAKIEIVPPGATYVPRAHADRDHARSALGLEPDCFHFVSIGFIQPHKGFDRTVEAFARLSGERLRLHVVGSLRVADGEVDRYTTELRQRIAEVPGAELHEGFISDEEFDRWIVAADAVVLPYRKIVSSAVLERVKLYDRPAVVSDVGGMPHQASETTTVVRDDEELAAAMARLAGAELVAAVPRANGSVDPAAVQDVVRSAAARLRQVHEPGARAPGEGAGWEPTPVVSTPLPSGRTRLRTFLKRVVSRLTVWQLQPLVTATNNLREGEIESRRRLEEAAAELAGTKHWIELQFAEVNARLERLAHYRAEDRAETAAMLARLERAAPTAATPPAASAAAAAANGAGDEGAPAARPHADLGPLYAAHQAEFRGSEEHVTARLRDYVPAVAKVAQPGAPVLDIGPGRGEWLRLLTEQGVECYGVDLNSEFVARDEAAGLKVVQGDGVDHLRSLADGSLSAITAFHVIEHVTFERLVELLDQAIRVLRPGGLLLLETPNPLNVAVGAASFWLDPTHVAPVHPALLKFALEHRGFVDVSVEPRNPPAAAAAETGSAGTGGRVAEIVNASFLTGMDTAAFAYRPGRPETAPQ